METKVNKEQKANIFVAYQPSEQGNATNSASGLFFRAASAAVSSFLEESRVNRKESGVNVRESGVNIKEKRPKKPLTEKKAQKIREVYCK